MPYDPNTPWNILTPYMGGPKSPPLPPISSSPNFSFNPFPVGQGVTNGMMAALPLNQQTPVVQEAANVQAPASFDGIPLKPGVPAPSGDAANLVQCIVNANPNIIGQIKSTSEYYPPRAPNDPHYSNQAVDIATTDPQTAMILGALCGAQYQQNEYTNPSSGSDGPHVHLQTRPGKGGATGPCYPPPTPTPRPDN